mmetsp:Transcript_29643/g.104417  ORF Transcript_29643/g.104417 Transcript_29643/m.104417 type:complete len:270 (+) Transcript_29643:481-1290(+)
MSTSKRLGFKGWALFWDGTSTKYNYRHIMHASIGVGDRTFEYDLSDIVEGSTAPETAAYLKSIVCDVMRRQAVLMVHCGLVELTYPREVTVLGMDNEPLNGAAVAEFECFRFVVLTRLEKVQPGAVHALASAESWAAFDAAVTLTEKLAVLKTLPGIERCAVYLAVSTAMRHELTLSTMAADLLRSLLEYKGEMLKLVRDGDEATTLEDHGGGYRAENRCEERALGAALRQLRTRSFRLRTGLGLGLALAWKPTITLDNVQHSALHGLP